MSEDDNTLAEPVGAKDHSQGAATAPVTLVEYGDYECPYCGEAYPILKEVARRAGASLRFVFRNFPLTQMHPHAFGAAVAAEAAALQGKFWEMHDMLYENQEQLEPEALLGYAKALKLDLERFARDAKSPAVEAKIKHDFQTGIMSGVNGTPSFFINGQRYDGPRDVPTLLAVLQEVSSQSSPPKKSARH